ncbi:MAG: protein phosphatase 2C domain-containing protein [Chloroflexi bacterium]|nr:protein phosphatase 2C domain-containing protein [Chloroflexota bacterium]
MENSVLLAGAEGGPRSRWRVLGASVTGAMHTRLGLPNQDALYWEAEPDSGLPLAVAVSDGHGSARSFRSALGAQLAVNAAASALGDLLPLPLDNLSAIKRATEEWLPQSVARLWQSRAREHLAAHPFDEEERARLDREGAASRAAIEANPLLAYGATVLGALVAEPYIVLLQLGDGDILSVSDQGEVFRPSWPRDTRLFANETTSLCARDAWRDVQVDFRALSGSPPALILLSSDGYANSFASADGFEQIGADLLALIRSEGLNAVRGHLTSWLEEASRAGSGDDITLAIVCRMDAALRQAPDLDRGQAPDAERAMSAEGGL